MRREIICFIDDNGLKTFTTQNLLTSSTVDRILDARYANDISQALVDNGIGYCKALYSPGATGAMDKYFIMSSSMFGNLHERNIYIINRSKNNSKCIFVEKYAIESGSGFIVGTNSSENADNLMLYCRAGQNKRYSLDVKFVPHKGCTLEYKLAI